MASASSDLRTIRLPRTRGDGDPFVGETDTARPLGVYVHFPFCSVRCPYCDFAVDDRPGIPHDHYADTVIGEIGARRSWFRAGLNGEGAAPPLRSIYFGGGTPGLWWPSAVGRVLEAARAAFDGASADALEVTIEANPGEVTGDHLAALRRAGVNRLSLGVQSFDDELLRRIGRNHDGAAGPTAFAEARAAGFENITCDLMLGLPGQSANDWRRALDRLIALGPEHVSTYALTIERGTPFASLERAGQLERPGDDAVAEMLAAADEALGAAGYEHYEISSYARPGRRAVHNSLYWTGGAYLGVGCSAASFRPLTDGTGLRFTNARATNTYLRDVAKGGGNPAPVEVIRASQSDLENDAVWLGLRLIEGIDRAAHAARFGRDPLEPRPRAEAARRSEAAGWLEVTPARIRLTRAGLLFGDEVALRLWI